MAEILKSFWGGRAEPVYRARRPGAAPAQVGVCSSGSEVLGLVAAWRPTTDPTMLFQQVQAALDSDTNPLCARSRQQAVVMLRQLDARARTMAPGLSYVFEWPKRAVLELMKSPGSRRELSAEIRVVRTPAEQPSRGRQITNVRRGDAEEWAPRPGRRAPWFG